MAKYERRIRGDFDELRNFCHESIMRGSHSASFEDSSQCSFGDVQVAVNVYERYSYFGGNRVSLNLTIAGEGDNLFLSAITSGGSQAVFFKLNTLGEESFLDALINAVESRY